MKAVGCSLGEVSAVGVSNLLLRSSSATAKCLLSSATLSITQPHHLQEGSTARAHLAGPGNRKHCHACDSTCHTTASIRAHPPPTIHTTTPILHRHPPAITSSSSASQQRSPAAVAFLCSGGVLVRGVLIKTQSKAQVLDKRSR